MAFASKNPFRTSTVLPHQSYTQFDPFESIEPAPFPMTPSHSAPVSAYRSSFNSNNPFFNDAVDQPDQPRSRPEAVSLRRSTSEFGDSTNNQLPDLLFELSVEERDSSAMPPPPPPPRSSRRQNLHAEVGIRDDHGRTGTQSQETDSQGIIEANMPLDRDNRPRELPPPARHHAHTSSRATPRHSVYSRQSGKEQDDPFATPPPASGVPLKLHHHRHAASSAAQLQHSSRHRQSSSSRDRSSHSEHEKKSRHHHKSRSHAQTGEKKSSPLKHHDKSSSPPRAHRHLAKKPSASMDKIDKLDVTGIFGTGFHHDGPFDACNPHRNTNKEKAPMLAFPIDSENNNLGMPRHLLENHEKKISGGTAVASNDPNAVIDPALKATPIHGSATLGLGTSTFLEGAPASRAAILQQKLKERESENGTLDFSKTGGSNYGADGTVVGSVGGLTRKKSVLQKIIGMNGSRERTLEPINVAVANRNRSQSVGEIILEEEEIAMPRSADSIKSPYVHVVAPRMMRQISSPSTISAGASRSPSSPSENGGLLKRVRSLKVGPRK
ncbi:Pal1 cell morphology protein-domain-containing protein [Lipomyces arxii]|uniref:Pal1 cell morphology protein-domain-containing protein n=1 Tax=Lipomyces arxii TaxID=56418 RepID=UPI0034CF09F1